MHTMYHLQYSIQPTCVHADNQNVTLGLPPSNWHYLGAGLLPTPVTCQRLCLICDNTNKIVAVGAACQMSTLLKLPSLVYIC